MSADVANDVNIRWDATSGASSYKYEILDPLNDVVRAATVAQPSLIYTYQQALIDGGPWPTIKVAIKAVDSEGGESADWTEIVVNNPFTVDQVAGISDVDAVSASLSTHESNQSNPHNVNKQQLGISGATGTFSTADGKTVSVSDGLVTSIS